MKIIIKNLSKSFNYKMVYSQFCMEVESGEKLGIFGPNGCGKTTLLKIISGILSYEKGEIYIDKNLIRDENLIVRKATFYLGPSVGLYRNFTARENLNFISKIYNNKNIDITDSLKIVGLYEQANKLIKIFSKGMLQRLKLAACLVSDTKILLLDEPLSGLDEKGAEIFSRLYDNWISLKKTILIVSHDKKWLKNRTDRILKLN